MKNFTALSILVFSAVLSVSSSFAQETAAPATDTATVSAATGTAPASGTLPAPPAPLAVEPKFVPVSPSELLASSTALYSGLSSFTIDFTLVQSPARGKIKEEHLEKYIEEYILIYLDKDLHDGEYLLRLEALKGYNRRTTAVYAPGNKGEYVYTIYKPALPNGSILAKDNILVEDIKKALPEAILKEISDMVANPQNEVTANFYPGGGKYVVEILYDVPVNRTKTAKQKTIVEFSPEYRLVSREIRVPDKDSFRLMSRMEWSAFDPGAAVTEEQITKTPKFGKE